MSSRPRRRSRSIFILNIIPDSVVGALARAATYCRCCCFAILFGFALMGDGRTRARGCAIIIDDTAHAVFGVYRHRHEGGTVRRFSAPWPTRSGSSGPAALGNLIGLIVLFYATAGLFVVVVLGLIARFVGFQHFSSFIALYQGRAADRARHQLLRRARCRN